MPHASNSMHRQSRAVHWAHVACLHTLVKAPDSDVLPAISPCAAYSLQVYLTVTDTQGAVSNPAKATLKAPTCSKPPVAKLSGGPYTLKCGGSTGLDGKQHLPQATTCMPAVPACYLPACHPACLQTPPSSTVPRATGAFKHDTFPRRLQILQHVCRHSTARHGTRTRGSCSFCPPNMHTVLLCCLAPTGTASSDPDGNDDIKGYTFYVKRSDTQEAVATLQSANGKATVTQAAGISSNTQYLIVLEVRDAAGNIGTANSTLTVGNCNPTAVMAITPSTTITCGGTVTLDGSKSSDSDGSIASYSWKLLYGNQTVSKSGATAVVSQATDKLTPGVTYSVQLTVKDNLGGSSSSSSSSSGVLTVQAGCVPPNNPPVCTNAKPSVTRISTLVSGMQDLRAQGGAEHRQRARPLPSLLWINCNQQHAYGFCACSIASVNASWNSSSSLSSSTRHARLDCSVNCGVLLRLGLYSLFVPCLLLSPRQDHSMKSVSITGVTDPDADAITIKITGVTQDEPVKGSDLSISGTWACPDAKIASTPTSVTLASECLNAKATTVSGRVYSIQYTATDSKGASCSGSVSVCAKPGTSGSCVDDGQLYNSVVCA